MKRLILILLVLSMILTTACWDMIELEDRTLPYSVAIDKKTSTIDDTSKGELLFCFSYPNINALGKNATQEELVFILNTTADSMYEAAHKLTTRIHNPIYLKHLNVVIMSEEVYSNERYLRQILDGIQRDFIINKMIYLLITRVTAHELLTKKLESKRQETVEGMFINLLRNVQESDQFTPIRVMEFIQDMDHKKASVVPLATPEEDIEISGGGLFKDYKFVGYIDGEDNANIALLNNEINNSMVDIEYNDAHLSILLTGFSTKKKLIKDQDILKIQYDIKVNGQIEQYILHEFDDINSLETMEDMEDNLNREIKANILVTVDKLQNEHNADALGILEHIYKFHPKVYRQVEEDWDGIFPHIDIEVNVDTKIRRRGLSEI